MKQIFSSSLIASLIFSMSSLSAATSTSDTQTGSITITVSPFVQLTLSDANVTILTDSSSGTTTSGSSATPLGINTISNDALNLSFDLDNLSSDWGSNETLNVQLYQGATQIEVSKILYTSSATSTATFTSLGSGDQNYSASFDFSSSNTAYTGNLTADIVVTATAL